MLPGHERLNLGCGQRPACDWQSITFETVPYVLSNPVLLGIRFLVVASTSLQHGDRAGQNASRIAGTQMRVRESL
jgi:hypothetical protein